MNRNCYRCLAVLTTGDADGLCSSCREKITNQAYQKIPNIVTEQIVIETKTSARMIPVTADKDSIDEINHAFAIAKKEHERLEKVEELLELYREHKYLVPFTTGLGEKSKRVHDIHNQITALEEELK